MARLLETDSNTNINISSATAIGAYTATKTRLVHVRVAVDQAAGAGDYVIYATLQIAGAGSSYVIIPKTTATAASGETALMFVSGPIPMDNADVLTVYLDGLAGDTTTPDTRVDFYEMDYLRPTVAGRTLTVAATGEASANVTLWKSSPAPDLPSDPADQSAVEAAITTAAGALATFAQVAGLNNLSSAQAQAAAAAALAAYGAATGAVPTVSDIVDGVLDEALSGHTIAGSVGAGISAAGAAGDPWTSLLPGAYTGSQAGKILGDLAGAEDDIDAIRLVTDAIDVSSVTLNPTNDAGHLTITAALTFETQITGLAVPSDWETALWTLKRARRDADTAAILQVQVSNPGAGTDGLLVLNGAAATDKTMGSLSINAGAGTADLVLSDDLTAQLAARPGLVWSVKFITAAGASKEYPGTADVELSVTHGI